MKKNIYKIRERLILKRVLYLMILAQVVAELLLLYCIEKDTLQERFFSLLSALSLAFIASYIFYYIVVVLKEKRDAKNINLIISHWIKELIGRGRSIVYLLEEAAERTSYHDWEKITQHEFEDLCMAANPTKESKKRLLSFIHQPNKPTYGQLVFHNSIQNVNSLIDRIFVYMPYLESDLITLISALKQSSHFKNAEFLGNKIGNQDFSAFSKDMFEYLQMLKDIADYHNKTMLPLTLKQDRVIKKTIKP